jgi:endothelin-converting enzyme/putative endopeptidase
MVAEIEAAMKQDIEQITWMTPETKKKAYEKLAAVATKIGYPEKWRDYTALRIDKADPIGNSLRANNFEWKRQLDKIGKPVDKKEWFMSPPTVNAYYNPLENNINFPAGILQPPFFEQGMDDPVNYGAIGAVVGHELTHGFDDQGRQFDAEGNLKDWWTKEDADEFQKRADCIGSQYGSFKVGDLNLNPKLTMGENVADNGGLRLAYMAMMDSLSKRTQPPAKIEGFTPQQRFFLGWAQVWCVNFTPENARTRALTDPHSPGQYRVNGTVSNMPEFSQAWGCKTGDAMNRGDKACRVW